MIPTVKTGTSFLCIKTLINDNGDVLYKQGNIYQCEKENCVTDETGNQSYEWWNDDYNYYKEFSEHFEQENEILDNQAIHSFFGLSYSSYLILPRVALQSMPAEWQRKFVEMVEQIPEHLPDLPEMEPASYKVLHLDANGKFTKNKFPGYRHNNLRSINDTPESAPWFFNNNQ